jgi:hypothetical protein
VQARAREHRAARVHAATEEEIAAHEDFLLKLKEPLWKRA